jgi:excisionase family DNA binding protein
MLLATNPRSYGLHKAAYSVNETLNLLSIGRTTLYRLIADGTLKYTKLGKKTLFYAADLAALLAKLREKDAA